MRISGFEDTYFPKNKLIRIQGGLIDLSLPHVMGILNLTPDSFFERSRTQQIDDAISRVDEMLKYGASIIDLGGQSTRPEAKEQSKDEELKRVMRVFPVLRSTFPKAIFSIDTFRSSVAEQTLEAGADLINDISGGRFDSDLLDVVARYKVPYILMHNGASFEKMHIHTHSDQLFRDLIVYFSKQLAMMEEKGITDCILDPGFGFGKTMIENFELVDRIQDLSMLGRPLLIGISRKSMIYKTLNTSPEEALNGTTVLHTKALLSGVSILRVHDVKEAMETIQLLQLTH